MAKRPRPLVPDWHLWTAVAETVKPLRPAAPVAQPKLLMQLARGALPLPPSAPPKPKKLNALAFPPYQSGGPRVPGAPITATGLEPRLRRRLGRGQIEIDATLDLHGMYQDEAYAALLRFVQARAMRGDRTILVITGKGIKKLNGDATTLIERGVLRAMLPLWLKAPELAPLVSGWDVSAPGHGGDGAYYVRLKRQDRAL